MNVSKDAAPSRHALVSKRAALSVAAVAVIGGAVFAPAAAAHATGSPAKHSQVDARCGDCYPDVI